MATKIVCDGCEVEIGPRDGYTLWESNRADPRYPEGHRMNRDLCVDCHRKLLDYLRGIGLPSTPFVTVMRKEA